MGGWMSHTQVGAEDDIITIDENKNDKDIQHDTINEKCKSETEKHSKIERMRGCKNEAERDQIYGTASRNMRRSKEESKEKETKRESNESRRSIEEKKSKEQEKSKEFKAKSVAVKSRERLRDSREKKRDREFIEREKARESRRREKNKELGERERSKERKRRQNDREWREREKARQLKGGWKDDESKYVKNRTGGYGMRTYYRQDRNSKQRPEVMGGRGGHWEGDIEKYNATMLLERKIQTAVRDEITRQRSNTREFVSSMIETRGYNQHAPHENINNWYNNYDQESWDNEYWNWTQYPDANQLQ